MSPSRFTRRDFLAATLGTGAALSACRRPAPAHVGGELLGQSFSLGHRLRDGKVPAAAGEPKKVGIAIVGGGASGLSAAWRLAHAGVEDFTVLELEPRLGGTAASEVRPGAAYPWGAHYVPVPSPENRSLIRLLTEVGAITGLDDQGDPICAEEMLCRAPQERLFFKGEWYEGLYLRAGASAEDLRQLSDFTRAMDGYAALKDGRGRRAFGIPVRAVSDDADLTALDRLSMADFMTQRGWTSPRLRWWVDYACRDDFGLKLEDTSAWAGVFYFASRIDRPGDRSAEFLTWPEGNGRLIRHLGARVAKQVRTGAVVSSITPVDDGVLIDVLDARSGAVERLQAEHVIFALPKFLASHVVAPWRQSPPEHLKSFRYSSWVVANVALRDRPFSRGFPTCWDNVLYESGSLGYVVSTHQTGRDTGPTVWTWYLPLCGRDPKIPREQLLAADHAHWADAVMSDLTLAHRGFPELVERIDVWRWGHAMIRPEPGFMWGGARQKAAEPFGRIHFASTDLSGVALFEEAHDRGVHAAEAVLAARGLPFESFL